MSILDEHFKEHKKYADLLNKGVDFYTASAKAFGEKTATEMVKTHTEILAIETKQTTNNN